MPLVLWQRQSDYTSPRAVAVPDRKAFQMVFQVTSSRRSTEGSTFITCHWSFTSVGWPPDWWWQDVTAVLWKSMYEWWASRLKTVGTRLHMCALGCHWVKSYLCPDSKWLFQLQLREKRGHHMDGLVQDRSISNALAMEILQSCTAQLVFTM